jgi:hypothetical protein
MLTQNHSNGVHGYEVARSFFERGFEEIFLLTGTNPNRIHRSRWIKDIVTNKAPPWEPGSSS